MFATWPISGTIFDPLLKLIEEYRLGIHSGESTGVIGIRKAERHGT